MYQRVIFGIALAATALGLTVGGTPRETQAAITLCADMNADGQVDGRDLVVWGRAAQSSAGDDRYNSIADLNGDGSVTMDDFSIWREQFGNLCPPPP
jgi:hypothetical protein